VGPANAFLSHSYGYRYVDVLRAVRAWEARQAALGRSGPFFYYFDLAVVNQHQQPGTVDARVLGSEFGEGVKACGRTLLVLRWADYAELAISRAWCLLEVATTLHHLPRSDLEIIMPPTDAAELCRALVEDFSSVEQRLCSINAADAGAREQADLDYIRGLITNELGGYGEVNERVLRCLREYVLLAAREALQLQGEAGLHGELAVRLGDFLRTMGRTKDGEAHLRSVLRSREGLLEARPTDRQCALSVAQALSALGSTVRLGDEGCPIAMLQRALDLQAAHLPPNDGALLTTTGRLGVALKDAGRLEEARPLYELALAGRRSTLGDSHPDTLFSQMNLAMLLHASGLHAEHDAIVADVVARRRAVLGDRHPHTLFARHRHGLALHHSGRLAEAAREMEEVCQLQTAVLGRRHKETLSSRALLARIWRAQGRAGAVEEAQAVVEDLQQKYGAEHVDTIRHTSALAGMQACPAAGAAVHLRAVQGVRGRAPLRPVLQSAERAARELGGSSSAEHRAQAAQLLAAIHADPAWGREGGGVAGSGGSAAA
jgi:tetratricopeptide (TPR) repeat protein